jgi:anti-anti-sigma factor
MIYAQTVTRQKAGSQVSLEHEAAFPIPSSFVRPPDSLTVVRKPSWNGRCVLYLSGPLRAPVDGALRHNVRALLRRGERIIVLDLTRVSRIDAAGVGELVRAYNMAIAENSVLQIVNAAAWVQEILERVGLFDILSEG